MPDKKKYGEISSLQSVKQSDSSYLLIMMDYFVVLFTFMSIECILLNEDAENMSIRNRVSIISSGTNQQWAKLFHHLRLVTVYKSYLNKAKHQTCQGF